MDRTFNERDNQVARVALRGPLLDVMPHYDLHERQDIVTAPAKLEVWRADPSNRKPHLYVWPPQDGRGDYAVRALDPRGQRLTFPTRLRGLRWVVEGRDARLHVGRLDALPFDDDAVVIEKRGGHPPWVRAGIGAVVSAKGGWAAVVGSHFVECFDLETGSRLLHTEFDPRPLGGLWIAAAATMLVVAFPGDDLVVFGPSELLIFGRSYKSIK